MSLLNQSGRGVLTNYGPRPTDTKYGGETAGESGVLRVVEFVFDYDELPALNTTDLAQKIPAGALITSASFEFLAAFVSTGSTAALTVGIADDDGGATLTDVDGIFTAAEITNAIIEAGTPRLVSSAGAVLNVRLAEAVQITVAPTVDDLTAGRAKLTVAYIPSVGAQGDQLQNGSLDQS